MVRVRVKLGLGLVSTLGLGLGLDVERHQRVTIARKIKSNCLPSAACKAG